MQLDKGVSYWTVDAKMFRSCSNSECMLWVALRSALTHSHIFLHGMQLMRYLLHYTLDAPDTILKPTRNGCGRMRCHSWRIFFYPMITSSWALAIHPPNFVTASVPLMISSEEAAYFEAYSIVAENFNELGKCNLRVWQWYASWTCQNCWNFQWQWRKLQSKQPPLQPLCLSSLPTWPWEFPLDLWHWDWRAWKMKQESQDYLWVRLNRDAFEYIWQMKTTLQALDKSWVIQVPSAPWTTLAKSSCIVEY